MFLLIVDLILAMGKLYWYFEVFFFLGIQLHTTHHELLKNFQPWKSCIVTMKVVSATNFAETFRCGSVRGVLFGATFKVLEHFLHSSSLLILAQVFAPFDYLHFSWCNLSWKFSVIGLNSGKFLSLYLGPFSQERMEHVFFQCSILYIPTSHLQRSSYFSHF